MFGSAACKRATRDDASLIVPAYVREQMHIELMTTETVVKTVDWMMLSEAGLWRRALECRANATANRTTGSQPIQSRPPDDECLGGHTVVLGRSSAEGKIVRLPHHRHEIANSLS